MGKGTAAPELLSCGADSALTALGQVIPPWGRHKNTPDRSKLKNILFCTLLVGTDYFVTSHYSSLYFLKIIWIIVFALQGKFCFPALLQAFARLGCWDGHCFRLHPHSLGTISLQIVQGISVYRFYKFTKILVSELFW